MKRARRTEPEPDTTPYDRLAWPAREVEAMLARGERKRELMAWFGADAYAELVQLALAAQAGRRRSAGTRGGPPRVWILPGIMGSKLGKHRRRGSPDDVIWVDALDILAGRLSELRYSERPAPPGARPIVALGAILHSYLRLWLRLAAAGFEPLFFDYDWRLDVRVAARQFAARVRSEQGALRVVAHSMGGLVARAALAAGALPALERLVLVGTPNFGSFAAVQALRGTYGVVRKLALIDLRHDADELASGIFSSFPSIYQLLPQGRIAGEFDPFDATQWPRKGPRPDPRWLAVARDLERDLAPADPRISVIAGSGERTIESAGRVDGEFVYTFDLQGDGTVPLRSAELPGAAHFVARASHSGLVRSAQVAAGIVEILRTGTSSSLAPTARQRSGERIRLTDTELRQQHQGKVDWSAMSHDQRREFLENINEPPPLGSSHGAADAARPLRIDIVVGDIANSDTAAVAASLFQDVRPMGAIAALDARLDGLIAEFRWRRILAAEAGRVAAIPATRKLGNVQAVLLVGLGAFDQLSASVVELAAENVAYFCARSGLADLTTVLWGAGSGLAPEASFEAQLRGFLRAPQLQRLVFRVRDADTARRLRVVAQDLVLATGMGIALEPAAVEPARAANGRRRVATGTRQSETAYLLMSASAAGDGSENWRAALLTSGSPAAIVAETQLVAQRDLRTLLRPLEADNFGARQLQTLGQDLPDLLLHATLRGALKQLRGIELVVVHDAATSRVPWETMRFGDWVPALDRGLSRRYAAEQLSLARFSEARRVDPELAVLLVANPTEDLPGAELERSRLETLLRARPGVQLRVIAGRAATRARLLAELQSGEFDVIHYAGHAFFDAAAPERSGIVCSDGNLGGMELRGLSRVPSLVVLNACESGRLRRAPRVARARQAGTTALGEHSGIAEALLRAGLASFVGTYWPVGDAAATVFATRFYQHLLQNGPIGAAVLQGRQAVKALRSPDWADYIHFGDPDFRLKARTDTTARRAV